MFRNAKDIITILGFKIRIDPSWFIIAVLIVWSLSTAYFPQKLEGASQSVLLAISVISMLGLFGSLILHELSHSLVARLFNLKVGGITLFVFGGVAELERDPESAKSEFWIAIAGPVMSLFLAGIFSVLASLSRQADISILVVELLTYLGLINLVLAVFNMVPAFPLDGGRVLRSALWFFRGDVVAATRIAGFIGKGFAGLLIAFGILSLFSGQTISGLWQILIGVFIFGASNAAYQELVMRHVLKDQTVSALMTRDPWVANVDENVQSLVDNVLLKRNVSFVPVMEHEQVLGYVDAAMIKTLERENWADTKLGDIYIALNDDNSTRSTALIQDVFEQMNKTGNRKLLITNKGKLEGVIALSDMLTYLAIRQGLGIYSSDNTARSKNTTANV